MITRANARMPSITPTILGSEAASLESAATTGNTVDAQNMIAVAIARERVERIR